MKNVTITYKSADKKTTINAIEWSPDDGNPIAILQIAHGITEHIGRYEAFAKFMTGKGFVVVCNDHIGHGKSGAEDSPTMYFGPKGSWKYAVKDLDTLLEITKAKYPGVPYGILGFSLGSYLVRTYLIDYPGKVDAAIIMGSGDKSCAEINVGLLAAWIGKLKDGDDGQSEFIDMLTFSTYNMRFSPKLTEFEWLCSDRKALNQYVGDRLRGHFVTPGLFREMLRGMSYTANRKNLVKMWRKLPVLLVSGLDDPVGDFGKGVEKTYASLICAGVRDTTLKLYPGLRHDLLHETSHLAVYNDLYGWLSSRLLKAG